MTSGEFNLSTIKKIQLTKSGHPLACVVVLKCIPFAGQ